ncbi:MAG: YbhB/YbcL family Raf kinase inhibitor-like protein [Chloroflexota bacterium]
MKTRKQEKRRLLCRMAVRMSLICLLLLLLPGCASGGTALPDETKMRLSVSSRAFSEGERIPVVYTGQGEDISPPIAWSGAPAETASFALIMDDPDAPGGTFTHWVLFNLPPDARALAEAIPTQNELSGGALQGKNDFGDTGYGGPSPPPGSSHRYRFTIYAADTVLNLEAGVSKKQVMDALEEHILAWGQLSGTYGR